MVGAWYAGANAAAPDRLVTRNAISLVFPMPLHYREKIRAVPQWRDSDVFTELERLVLEYAEAMTDTPPSVTDEMVARLRTHLSEAELVELTAIVAVEAGTNVVA